MTFLVTYDNTGLDGWSPSAGTLDLKLETKREAIFNTSRSDEMISARLVYIADTTYPSAYAPLSGWMGISLRCQDISIVLCQTYLNSIFGVILGAFSEAAPRPCACETKFDDISVSRCACLVHLPFGFFYGFGS